MNFTQVIATYGSPASLCACAVHDSADPALLRDDICTLSGPHAFVGGDYAFRNVSHTPGSPWELLVGDWSWGGIVVLTSIFVMVVATWYLRHRDKDIGWSDGEKWAAPGQWVRPISNLEHLFGSGAFVGSFNTAQVLFLQSTLPITFDLVHRSLTILTERVLVLQLTMAWRGWWPWYRRTNTITVPLSESNEDPMFVYRRDLNLDYQVSKGPLWRATLVHQPSPCAGTYEAVLVLTIHHAVTDGTTNMVVSRDLLTIINGLITGKGANTPLRGLVPPLAIGLLSTFDVLPSLTFFFSGFYVGFCHLLSRGAAHLLPPPDPGPPATSAVLHDFSKEVTTQLASRCKESGVRIHSCLLAACSLAYLRTARQNKQSLKNMKVIHETAVNIRRYYPASQQEGMGTVSLIIDLRHHVSEDQDFWALAKTMQEDLYTVLDKDRLPLRLSRLAWMLSIVLPANKFFWWLGLPGITYSHFHCTNMGNLSKLLPTEYNGPVRIARIIRSTASELTGTCFTVVTQTLGGRLLLSLDSYTTKTTKQTANDFFSHVTQILTDIAIHGTPLRALTCAESNGHIKSNGHIDSTGHIHSNGHIDSNRHVKGSDHISSNDHVNSNNNGQIPLQCNGHKHNLTQTSITPVCGPKNLNTDNNNYSTLNYNTNNNNNDTTFNHTATAQPIRPHTNTNHNLARARSQDTPSANPSVLESGFHTKDYTHTDDSIKAPRSSNRPTLTCTRTNITY